nr:MAG TPA: hypothetical protein [Caudoviricetes sp.]
MARFAYMRASGSIPPSVCVLPFLVRALRLI